MNFYDSWRDYYAGLGKAWNEATEKLSTQLAQKLADSQQDPQKPIDFGTFYDMWQEIFSKTYIELLSQPSMIEVQTRLSSSTMDVVKYWREMWEAMLSSSPMSPFPTKSEMDETYRRLHFLKRGFDEVSQKLEAQPTRSEIDGINKALLALKKQVDGIGQKVELQASKAELDRARESLRLLEKEVDDVSRTVETHQHVIQQTAKDDEKE
jgi:hypothetical protein